MKTQTTGRNRRGFSLMELLVVIVIIVILAGMVIGGFAFVQERQAREKAKIQIGLLMMALEEYKTDHGEYPVSTESNGERGTEVVRRALFPREEQEQTQDKIYLSELDPNNDPQDWIDDETSRTRDLIVDPWGNAYRYRSADPSSPDTTFTTNPGFDLWSAGPDGKTQPGEGGEYDPQNDINQDDIGW